MAKEVSAGGVIYRVVDGERKFLLLHYNYKQPHWDFPKGKIEEGEQPVETARREVKEETGITQLDVKEGFMETVHYFFSREGETVSKDVHYFLMETTQDKVTLSKEHIGYVWLNFAAAMKRLSFKNSQEVLQKAEGISPSCSCLTRRQRMHWADWRDRQPVDGRRAGSGRPT